jgi:hypothetical protein
MAEAQAQATVEASEATGPPALEGEFVTYDDGGRVVQRSNFKGGVLEGLTTMFDEDGRVAQRVTFKDGLMDGPAAVYTKGSLLASSQYKTGKLDGETVTYDEAGRVTQASVAGATPGAEAYGSTALRVARGRRFPAGKPGSTVITIPVN